MKQLENTIAVVTGASRSIGKAIAIGLAREGAKLALAARTLEGLNATAGKVKEAGSEALVIPTDVRVEEQIENLFKKTMEHYGRLDILVNNAGIFGGAPFDELPTEIWDDVIATNLRGQFLCARAAFRIMKKQGGGRIINIGSVSASRVRPANAPYSSAKFGLVGLTQTIALEGREYNINCGILHPGVVRRDDAPPGPDGVVPLMEQDEIAAAAVYMACQPNHVNVLEIVQLPKDQPYLGRG
ncbi:MAG: SDR family oxidoreductase [Dehalococcoidia bacterium]|jgi:NAD(P)-dependent dehydrogenase (short-subunit alcohol dehydrogenase family)